MRTFVTLLIAATGCVAAIAAPASARPHNRDQDVAFEARQQGKIMPLRTIESIVIPQMPGADYIGAELGPDPTRYRLKFFRKGRVIWVDVDGRTGRVLGRMGD
jgi:uncharacterized membrane protein YkoI